MATILRDGKYESDIQTGAHGDRFQKNVALAMFLRMRENPNLRLGYEVKAAGKFDDFVLIDDKNQVIHFVQIKHGSVQDGKVKPIDREALFPQKQGKGDFEISKYLKSYDIVRKDFQEPESSNQYRNEFYILTNKVFDKRINENVKTVEQSDGNDLLHFFGSTDQTFKLTQDAIEDLRNRVNKDILEVKIAIESMFLEGKVCDTLKNYSTPLKAVLTIDKNKQCRFLDSFISESEESENNSLYNVLTEEKYDMTKTVTVNVNFLQKDSRFKCFPSYVSEEVVEEFIRDFSLVLGQPHDIRPRIDNELDQWLRSWVRPDILGKISKSDMDRAYSLLKESFDSLCKPQQDKKRFLLKAEDIETCLVELKGAFEKLDGEDATECNEVYINRRITFGEKTEKVKNKIGDTQFAIALRSRFKDEQCIVIVADPGMGKTALLKFLAYEVQKNEQKNDFNVFLVYFNSLIRALKKVESIAGFDAVIRVLQTVLSEKYCDIIKNAPEQRVNDDFSILLVMDGFDEIHSSYSTKVIQMLKLLREKQSIQIVISSRLHTQNLLQKEFGVQSMFLEPFSMEDQLDYLKKLWSVSKDAEQFFDGYSQKLLKNFRHHISSYKYDVCGIPLMMRMLGEIQSDKFKLYLETAAPNQAQQIDILGEIVNVVQLYEQFIRINFRLKVEEKTKGNFDETDLDSMIAGHILQHQLLAFKLLGIRVDENLFKNVSYKKTYDQFRHNCEKESERSRLVKVVGNEVQFSHLSFGEYFVAKYICDYIHMLKAGRTLHVLSEHELIRKFSMIMFEGIDQNVARLDRLCEIDLRFAKWACESGCFNIVSFLIEQIKPLLVKDLSMLLGISAKNGHVEICGLLLEHGADPNKCDKTRQMALHLAAREDHVGVVKLLLSHNANVSALDKSGWTPLHAAAEKGNVQLIQLLITAGANTNFQVYRDKTPLHIAVQKGHEEASKLLIDNNADVNMVDKWKRTALHFAVEHCRPSDPVNLNLVKLLVEHGANVNAIDEDGQAVICMAAEGGNVQAIRLLIEAGANPNCLTNCFKTLLHLAAWYCRKDAAELFITYNNDVNAIDDKKRTALHHVAICYQSTSEKAAFVELLLQNGANVNAVDRDGMCAIHLAAIEGDLGIIELLIRKGAITNSCADDGRTLLHIAASRGHEKVSEVFINHGINVNAVDKEQMTALHFAASSGNIAIVKLLLKHYANVSALDKHGRTPLHLAAENGHVQVIQALIEAGAIVNSRTAKGRLPLHMAAAFGKKDAAELLIIHNSDVDAMDDEGCTALHLAPKDRYWSCLRVYLWKVKNGWSDLLLGAEGNSNNYVGLVALLLNRNANVNVVNKNGYSVLHMAANRGDVRIMQSIISLGVSINSRTQDGTTPLHIAAMRGHTMASKLLIDNNADVNAIDNNGYTALLLAARSGCAELVELLLNHNANVNIVNEEGCTVLHMAAQGGNVKLVQALINAGAATNLLTNRRRTPLHFAAENGFEKVAKLLIRHNNDVNALDVGKCTALHLAVRSGLRNLKWVYVRVVDLLIRHDADVNAPDRKGLTPLHSAAETGNAPIIQSLVDAKALVNSRTNGGETPLHYAARRGKKKAVEILIDHHCDVNAINDEGSSALHFAARAGHAELVKLLLKHHANINALDKDGQSCLHMAAWHREVQIIQLLMTAGMSLSSRTKSGGRTLLHIAAMNGNKAVAELLILENIDVNAVDSQGCTALHLAVLCESSRGSQHKHAAVVRLLRRHHAHVNAIDKDGRTALHNAAKKGKVQIMQSLITAGAKINTRTKAGRTCLHEAAREGHKKASKLLISHGIDVNAVDIERSTALHLAAQFNWFSPNHVPVVEVLLRHHADVNVLDENGRSPLQLAIETNRYKVAELLIAADATDAD